MPVVLVGLTLRATGDSGYYTRTSHGNPATGVQRDTSLAKGSCGQCHVGHGAGAQDFGLWTANNNDLCFTCHGGSLRSYFGQTQYNMSGHSVSASSMNGKPVGYCTQCHNPHGSGDLVGAYPHMTGRSEEEVCFVCHGTGFRPTNAVDVQTQVNRAYSHRVADQRGKHDDDAERSSVAVNPNPLLSGTNRHVECTDCHNTHFAKSGLRASLSSNIGEMLLGSWGVRPTFSASPWTAPTSYAVVPFQSTATEQEYYLCLKCHSSWAWGSIAPYTTDGTRETDQGLEFSPSNPAYHNVTGQTSFSVPSEDVVYGTSNPPAYVSPWGPNSAMACTDCHASDSSLGSARTPHGSQYNYMLKKRFKAVSGASDNTGSTGTQSDLCFDCHEWATYGRGGEGGNRTNFRKENDNLHRKSDHARAGCFQCHSAVPHGFKRKHLIVYVSDGPPYYLAGGEGITSYTHANGGAYSESNCATTSGCHGD